MNLRAYFERIRFDGHVRPDLATLVALHRAHQLAVPFENIDVQLRRNLTPAIDAAFEKIVTRRRGGWCYEMNGLFGWVLETVGFEVIRLCAGVMREQLGDVQLGNHLCLLVRLDKPYLVDVGFGGTIVEPLPLDTPLDTRGRVDSPYHVKISESDDGYLRFSEVIAHRGDDARFSFDFRIPNVDGAGADEARIAEKCAYLQADAASPFVQNLVVQRRSAHSHTSLRGRVLTVTHADRQEKSMLTSADELITTLRMRFDLDVPEARGLWTTICTRHRELFGDAAANP